MAEQKFVEVAVTATGEKRIVPKSWVGHPVLWEGLRELPSANRAAVETVQEEGI